MHIYIYIYIYYTLHTLFGPLDLMSQSSELEWAHKKIKQQYVSNPIMDYNAKIKWQKMNRLPWFKPWKVISSFSDIQEVVPGAWWYEN